MYSTKQQLICMSMRTVKLALFPAWKYPRILQAASFSPTKCTWKTGEIFGGLEKLMGVITPVVLKIPNPDLKETGITCQVGMLKPKNEHCLQRLHNGGTDWYEETLTKPFRGRPVSFKKCFSLQRGFMLGHLPRRALFYYSTKYPLCGAKPALYL